MLTKVEIPSFIRSKNINDIIDLPNFVYVNKFDEETVKSFRADFSRAHDSALKVIPILIDSYGGQVYSLLSMVDIIKSSQKPVATISLGKSMSCGAVLFTCGSEGLRFMAPQSTLMIHDVSSGSFGKTEEIKADAKEVDRLNDLIYGLMARNVGKHDRYFWDIVQSKGRADWFLTAQEAKDHNLANQLRVPTLKVSFKMDVEFE